MLHIPVVSQEWDRGAPGRGVNADACPTLPGAPALSESPRESRSGPRWGPDPRAWPRPARGTVGLLSARASRVWGGLETPDLLRLPSWDLGDPGPQLPASSPAAGFWAAGDGRAGGSVPGWGQRERHPHPPSVRNASCPNVASGRAWGPPVTGKGEDLISCLVLPAASPAGPSCLQMPLPGSGVARPHRRSPLSWWGGGGAGLLSPPPRSQARPLKNNEVQVALREARPLLAAGPLLPGSS